MCFSSVVLSLPSKLKIAKKQPLKKCLFLGGGPQKSPRKYPRKSKNAPKSLQMELFDFLGLFRGLLCGPPKDPPLLENFGDLGPSVFFALL